MSGKPYTLEERDGRQVRVYESGTVLDNETGKLVHGPLDARITSANASTLAQRRHTLAAQKLRKRILDATQAKSTLQLTGPADAVAEAGGILWDEIVLDSTGSVYPRDRLQAFEMLGKHAGILSDPKQQAQPEADPIEQTRGLLRDLAQLARDAATLVDKQQAAGQAQSNDA